MNEQTNTEMTLQEAKEIAQTDKSIYCVKQSKDGVIGFVTMAEHKARLLETKKGLCEIVDTQDANNPQTLRAYHQIDFISSQIRLIEIDEKIRETEDRLYASRTNAEWSKCEKQLTKLRKQKRELRK